MLKNDFLIPHGINSFFAWDAIVSWRDSIYQADFWGITKSCYLSGMLKLIELGVVDVRLPLVQIDDDWLNECRKKIDTISQWSTETKVVRSSCLNSFYNFIKTDFDFRITPYRSHPKPNEIRHILSIVQDKKLTVDISPKVLCYAVSKINERDAYVVWLMMWTGHTLDEILDLKKEDYASPYIRFKDDGRYVPPHITDAVNKLCENSKVYLFETVNGKRVTRHQVIRNLKKAGRNIGLTFDLTSTVLCGYVNAYMSADKRSELEKACVPIFH